MKNVAVRGKEGIHGVIHDRSEFHLREQPNVLVELDEGPMVKLPTDMLEEQPDGSFYLPYTLAEVRTREGHNT